MWRTDLMRVCGLAIAIAGAAWAGEPSQERPPIAVLIEGLTRKDLVAGSVRCITADGRADNVRWEEIQYAEGYTLVRLLGQPDPGWTVTVRLATGWKPSKCQLIRESGAVEDLGAHGYEATLSLGTEREFLLRHGQLPSYVPTLRHGESAVAILPPDLDDSAVETTTPVVGRTQVDWVVVSMVREGCESLD